MRERFDRIVYWLGLRNYLRERECPHPPHRIKRIGGDERNYGYLARCMECGKLFRTLDTT